MGKSCPELPSDRLVLDFGHESPIITGVLGTELAYVREKLKPLTRAERKAIAAAVKVHWKTIDRLVDRRTKYGRTDTVGKLALHFRTRDRRAA